MPLGGGCRAGRVAGLDRVHDRLMLRVRLDTRVRVGQVAVKHALVLREQAVIKLHKKAVAALFRAKAVELDIGLDRAQPVPAVNGEPRHR